ncbi:hypothetical protein [Paenibacillus sp. YPG26]|uniref:hypothetical protein n=1 Tax=Paenibacillus sp. YPG26 TaxID=2878915 RepID=UPI00203D955D|nr:hypothetical protein [Paenibacillus sp. YPG26]USB33517.1 hypothetical protein LDO05_01410 [Paenibacillus sp. YPG26]
MKRIKLTSRENRILIMVRIYKARYDVSEITKLQAIMLKNPGLLAKKYRKLMEYPNTLARMLLGYKDEVEGKGRNFSLV